ncbi:Formin-like protein 2-like [Scleropages formosus]|uniref:Formin-like protein 2-like n=1 Tax=Scleropages formosus TaxID=113540 RepID=A0A0P7XQ14_SCLFO|nr:Formin-like protein 2-like [Scleropages formosus]
MSSRKSSRRKLAGSVSGWLPVGHLEEALGNHEATSPVRQIIIRAAPCIAATPPHSDATGVPFHPLGVVWNSMNLPPDKARLLRQYDNEKKWELICDQERFQVKNPPHTYIQKLRGYLDPAVTRKKFRRRVQESTQVLRELEISLRTNHIGWVREFLNEENKGLDVLVEYLSFAQYAVTFDFDNAENPLENAVDKSKPWSRSIEDLNGGSNLPSPVSGSGISRSGRHSTLRCNTLPSRRTLKNSRLVCRKDDVHVCIMCLRAIMNYQYGFNMVMSHPHAVNEIALSLNNKNPRTKALVLELLAAVCLVRGGHEIILSAFDNFKEVRGLSRPNDSQFAAALSFREAPLSVCAETQRFEKLMEYFKNEDNNIDFMKLKHTESDKLQVQIQAYLDNVFDVGALLEDAETKNAALERVEELEENMSHLVVTCTEPLLCQMTEKLQDTENEAMAKIVELEKQLMQRNKELETMREVYKDVNTQVHTLRRMVKEKDEAIQRQCNLEKKIHELEKQGTIKIQKKGDGDISILASPGQAVSLPLGAEGVIGPYVGGPPGLHSTLLPGMEPLAPPPPPPPPPVPGTAVKIKKPIKTKFRMPVFNWVALKPNQINGTVFNEIDDERILEDLNVDEFEEMFKTKAQGPSIDMTMSKQKVVQKGPNKVSLLDANRAKNLAITLRKAGKMPEEICKAIQMFDLRTLPVDFVECLMRFMPTENEVKALRQYERERKPLEGLTDEDRFMMHFSKIERLMQKMTIMAFMGNFNESVQMLTPGTGSGGMQACEGLLFVEVLQAPCYLHAAVSLENVLLDVKELQRGLELTRREYSMHGHNTLLKDFIAVNEGKLKKLQDDAKIAQDAFDDVVKFFGENSKTTPPSVFFPVFVRFVKAYRQAEEDNEQRKRQEQMMMEKLMEQEAMMEQEDQKSPSHKNKRQQQELIAELRKKQVKDSRHVYEGKDGAIEDIITEAAPHCPVLSGCRFNAVLKTVPFTARTAKRGSRFLCEPTHTEEFHY